MDNRVVIHIINGLKYSNKKLAVTDFLMGIVTFDSQWIHNDNQFFWLVQSKDKSSQLD